MSDLTDRLGGARGSLAYKAPCRVAATSNVTLSGFQTIDGVTLADGDANLRVLLTGQTDASENGIYVAASGLWSRAKDWNGTGDVVTGTRIFVHSGSSNAGTWAVTTADTIVIGTTEVTISAQGSDHSGSMGATDNVVPRTDGATGSVLQSSIVLIDDSGNICPVTTDVGGLGTSSLMWSDLYLASGAVMNWNAGDVTLTHSANALAFAGASSGYSFDATVKASANDGAALGASGTAWSDLFLASGAVLDFAAGDVTFTHSANKIDIDGGVVDFGSVPTVNAAALYYAGGTDVALADGGTGASLADPGADRVLFWDDSAGGMTWLTVGDGLAIDTTTLSLSSAALSAVTAFNSGDKMLVFEGGVPKLADYDDLPGAGAGISNVVEDATPQLGGDLDANTYAIQFDDATGIEDDSGNEQLLFQKTASAVNYFEMTNAATGNDVTLAAAGSDADVGMILDAQGSEYIRFADAAVPNASDGAALGTSSLMWSDLYLASGSVVSFDAGDVTITHSLNALDIDGGVVDFGEIPTVNAGAIYYAGGTDVALADGGTGASLADPGADRILFWDDSAGSSAWLTVGDGLTVTTTTMAANFVQAVYGETATYSSTSTVLPADNSIPQNTEGAEIMTASITPKSATNKLRIDVTVHCTSSGIIAGVVGLFQDTTANALAATFVTPPNASYGMVLSLSHVMDAGSTAAMTFKVRAGPGSAGTLYINGYSVSRLLGGVMKCTITITEYTP